jgi:hypothetical protein
MKFSPTPRLTVLIFLAFLFFRPISIPAQGTVVAHNLEILSQFPNAPPGTYISQKAGGFFVLSVNNILPEQYQFRYYGIAELYSVHSASLNLAFTPAYVIGDTPLLNNNDNPGEFTISLAEGESRLFAYWDDAYFFQPGIHNVPDVYDKYGWFRLTRTASGLEISDSATAFGGGIRVGTYTAIPEPSCLALCSVALLGLLARRRTSG